MTTRDERLTSLETAVTEWSDRHIEELENQVVFLHSVFAGRTNGGRVADYGTTAVSALLEEEINAFLVG